MTTVIAMLLAVLVTAGGEASPGIREMRLAQSFQVHEDDAEVRKKPKKKKKTQTKPKPIKSEKDLWTEPAEESKGKPAGKGSDPEPEVEEISPEDIEEEGEEGEESGDGDYGGWGADAEREAWGDEKRIDNRPLDGETAGVDLEQDPKRHVKPEVKKPEPKTPEKVPVPAKPPTVVQDAEPKPVPGKPAPDTEDAKIVAERLEILPQSGTLADLAALWEQRRIHLEQHDFELAGQDLERVLILKQELTIRNMVIEANVLLREAKRAEQAEDLEKAQVLVSAAIKMAPDLSAAHLAQASLWFSQSPFSLGRVFGALRDAAEASFVDPLASNRVVTNLLIGLLIGLSLTAAIFIVIQFLRYLRLFFHDFHHLFPRGVARLQTALLGVLLILLPIMFRSGLLVTLLMWAFLAWIYQERNERVITVIVLVFFALVPLTLEMVVSGLSLPRSVLPDLLQVAQGPAPRRSVVRLKSVLAEQPENHVILTTLGSFYKRTGELEKARQYLDQAARVRPDSALIRNNLGNVLFLQNDVDRAAKEYSGAIRTQPDLAIPHFNLSRAYYHKLDLVKGKQHRRHALRLDAVSVSELVRRASSRKANDVVADVPIPREWFTSQVGRSNGLHEQATGHLWSALGGAGSAGTYTYVGGALVVLFMLFLLARGKMNFSSGCVRCGRPVCRRCDRELKDDSLCGQCYHAFVKKDHVDTKAKISKEIQIRQHLRRKESLARGITFLLPGAGQFIKERPLRGSLFLFVFCCVLTQVWLGSGVMRNPEALGTGIDWLKLVPLFVLLLGIYLWAILDVFRVEH